MELIVLGRSAAGPNAGEACPSHLIRKGDVQLVLDCGTGCVSKLRQVADYRKISAVFISHMHYDHFGDLPAYIYGVRLVDWVENCYRPKLYLPPGGREILIEICEHERDLASFIPEVFEVHEYDPGSTYRLGSLQVGFVPVKHFTPTWGMWITEGGKKFAYSADAGLSEELVSLAAGADLFLCEAAWEFPTAGTDEIGHLTARQAGEVAAKAKVKKLVLVHIWKEYDWKRMLEEACDAFGGPVEIAEELRSYFI